MRTFTGSIVKRDKEQNRYTVRATTDTIDRQGERVMPAGVTNLKQFLQTGSILYGHDWSAFPIGKPLSAEVNDKELLIDIAFAETDLGKEARYLYDEGFLSSFSIGFKPDWEKIDVIDGVRTYKAWELLELSGVPVPANAEATILREAESRRGAPLACIAKMLANDRERLETNPPAAAGLDAPEASASPLVGVVDKHLSKRSRLWTS